jgi:tripartite-type tricarboxylate transporter receptor subunit TctC
VPASGGWFGIAVKAGTPVEIQDKLIAAGLDLLKQQATIERLGTLLSEPVGAGKEEFGHFLAEERQRWGSLIADLKLKN